MRKEIKPNQTIELKEVESSNTAVFTIDRVIGSGASCIVYDATKKDGEGNRIRFTLKEFYPYSADAERNENNQLLFSDLNSVKDLLERFVQGYQKQIEFQNSDETANITSGISGIYTGAETKYVAMSRNVGKTLAEKSKEISLADYFEICLSTAKAVKKYHESNYLHLDLKPENIFVLDETNELVVLFDFDSVTDIDEITNGSAVLSYSQDYAAPELKQGNNCRICVQTDFYSIGAMAFERLFGRCPSGVDIAFPFKASALNNVEELKKHSPKSKELVANLIKQTLTPSILKRFENDNALITSLEAIVEELNKKHFLISTLPSRNKFFIGRDKELNQLHEMLRDNRIVFLSGVGGIGKSKLAIEYGNAYASDYDSISFGMCNNGIKSFVTEDSIVHISNYSQKALQTQEQYYKEKMSALQEIADERSLIIIDNFNSIVNNGLGDLENLKCKIIITTRANTVDLGYATISVEHFSDIRDCERLFFEYYKKTLNDDENDAALELLQLTGYHTITIELLAKQMKTSRVLPSYMLDIFKNHRFQDGPKERVSVNKDSRIEKTDSYSFIRDLFDFAELNNTKKYVLANLSLMPLSGVDVQQFSEWCKIVCYDEINELSDSGWVNINDDDLISLHPVITEVVLGELKPDSIQCENLIDSLCNTNIDNNAPYYQRKELCDTVKAITERIILSEELVDFSLYSVNLLTKCSDYISAEKALIRMMLPCKNSYKSMILLFRAGSALYDKMTDYKLAAEFKLEELRLLSFYGTNEQFFKTAIELCELKLKRSLYIERFPDDITSPNLPDAVNNKKAELFDFIWHSFSINSKDWGAPETVIDIVMRLLKFIGWNFDFGDKGCSCDPQLLARAHNTLCRAYMLSDNYKAAEACARMAVSILTQYGFSLCDEMAWSQYYLGKSLENTKSNIVSAALSCYDSAIDIRYELSKTEQTEEIAVIKNVMGNWLSVNGDYDRAIDCFREARETRELLFGKISTEYAWTLYCEGENYFRRNFDGDIEKAWSKFTEVLSIYQSILNKETTSHKFLGLTYEYLGDICDRQTKYSDANAYYSEAENHLFSYPEHYKRVRDKKH